jgi:competence protein ComEC
MEVTAIDVGEGESILVITPTGKTLLVDARGPIGPGGSQLDFGEDVVSPYLWERGFTHLDAVSLPMGTPITSAA